MRWIKPSLRSSVYSLLGGQPEPASESVLENRTEDIRQAMLDAIGETGVKRFPQISRRIRFASDVQALWYLRGDLMAALAAMQGEATARERINSLTSMFRGLLPGGMASRPSSLTG